MMTRLVYLTIALLPCLMISAQQIDKVIISGYGGQHDQDVMDAFLIGYSSYDNSNFNGNVSLYTNTLQASFDYAVANDYNLIIRSTTGLATGLNLAPNYPSVKLVMPAGSNSYVQVYSGDVINSPVVITGAGQDTNLTGYTLEFFSIDPITGNYYSSYSNGFIAGQLAFIANTLNCSFDSARVLAREYGSENGNWDFYNGFGKVDVNHIISSALPVELTSFTASANSDGILLKWKTKTEVNNYGFDVERGVGNGEWEVGNWEKIGFVEGSGNSNSPKQYSFNDNEIKYGKYSYRLKQIDNDGSFEYSKVVEIDAGELKEKFILMQNYPNPFNPTTTIRFVIKKSNSVKLIVYDLLGNQIATLFDDKAEANKVYEIEFSAIGRSAFDGISLTLPSGIYIYRLESDSFVESHKMLLIK